MLIKDRTICLTHLFDKLLAPKMAITKDNILPKKVPNKARAIVSNAGFHKSLKSSQLGGNIC